MIPGQSPRGIKAAIVVAVEIMIGKAISLLPLPVISGIGHQRDFTVVDEVSNRREKTPTAVALSMLTAVAKFFLLAIRTARVIAERIKAIARLLTDALLFILTR